MGFDDVLLALSIFAVIAGGITLTLILLKERARKIEARNKSRAERFYQRPDAATRKNLREAMENKKR